MTEIKKQQRDLVASIKAELTEENDYIPSPFWHSVWFKPSSGRFLFGEKYIRYRVVEQLIANKTLVFKGVEIYQGEKMLRYVLSE